MTLFASRTPRDLNNDPIPYIERAGEVFYEPRPEFDHAQHNPPNPILVEFRGDELIEPTYYEHLCWWLWMLDENAYEGWSHAHISHARRVLTRLANLARKADFRHTSTRRKT